MGDDASSVPSRTLITSRLATSSSFLSHSGTQQQGTSTSLMPMPPALNALSLNQSDLFKFVHMVNELYQTHLKKQPPFVRFVLIGLQSTGKSTVVERLIKFPMNIVAEGTGTRCPLYITCINDPEQRQPLCKITGCPSCPCDADISHRDVFNIITKHNMHHVTGSFSATPLRLSVRSASVQNLIFVDLPGIIVTKGQGEDMREGIKDILQQEMKIPNSNMLVLLEPKEYATNSILAFIDETVGARHTWLPRTIFMMTKFDLRTSDSLTGSKSNRFFDEFWDNGPKPYMVITPTMQRAADTFASPEDQYKERQRLLDEADGFEKEKFNEWKGQMMQNYEENNLNETFGTIDRPYADYVGFSVATKQMFTCILADVVQRLPEVLRDIARELRRAEDELSALKAAEQFADTEQMQATLAEVLHHLVKTINEYMSGSLRIAKKMMEEHQTLDNEIHEERESEWSSRSLNHLATDEQEWREHICRMIERNALPEYVHPQESYLGGKQFQRAISFFKATMMDRIPTPNDLEAYVPSVTSAMRDGVMMESWEHETVGIINECVRGVAQAGINYFVKHAMTIFHRLLRVALLDAKKNEACSNVLRMMPQHIENFILLKYDELVWDVGMDAARSCHDAIKPYYSTRNPSSHAKSATKAPVKAHWGLYRDVLVDNTIGPLYHFTDKRNLDSIRICGLQSRALLLARGARFVSASDRKDIASHEALGLDNHVHLSFGPEHQSCFAAQKKKRVGDCALLEIDPGVVTWRETKFADANILVPGYQIGETLDDLKRVRFGDATVTRKEAKFGTPSNYAAVFVLDSIPVEYITIHEDGLPRKVGCCGKKMDTEKDMASSGTAAPPKFLVTSRNPPTIERDDEVKRIFDKAYQHVTQLCDLILPCLDFQFNHYLLEIFKEKLQKEFGYKLAVSPELAKLSQGDTSAMERSAELKCQIEKLNEALFEVQRLQCGKM